MKGIDTFREHFKDFEDHYALIGGAACDLIFGEAGVDFRATRDIDLVLCVEIVSADFAKQLAKFLDAGGYQAREKSSGDKEFFRFHKPKDDTFPFMLEFFARTPEALGKTEFAVTSVPVEDDIMSLSAILLNDDYYDALIANKRKANDIVVLDESLLIPFKARAVLDQTERSQAGEKGLEKGIRKHRNDVFRLLQLLPADGAIELPQQLKVDLTTFLSIVETDETFDPNTFGVSISKADGIALLKSVYGISDQVGEPETSQSG